MRNLNKKKKCQFSGSLSYGRHKWVTILQHSPQSMSRSNSLYVFCLFLSYYNFYFFFREKSNAFNPNIILHDKNEHINGGFVKNIPRRNHLLGFFFSLLLNFLSCFEQKHKIKKNKTKQKKEEALFIGGGSYVL